jgi:hypothetical protein
MHKPIVALLVLMVLATCSRGYNSAPQNLDNACSIITERPGYIKAMRNTEEKWGVPVSVQMATIYQESRFKSRARTPHRYSLGIIPMGRQSTAYGYAQALDGTWDDYKRGPGRSRAKRHNIKDATDFMGWYMNQSRERNGIALTDARNQYLAYHEGHAGYARGSYNSKSWLLKVAGDVAERANMYHGQLITCRRFR